MKEEPMFPFGFGLSYTTFRYDALATGIRETAEGKGLRISCTIKNTGEFPSDEVVQLYLSREDVPFRIPLYDLRGFRRIHMEPGETDSVVFNLSPEDLLLINEKGESVYLPGKLKLYVGGSLPDARSKALGAGKGLEAEVVLL